MKGITHFAVGIATASCFPQAVHAGAAGNPLYFILAGIFGLMPDTLDFKFYRFFYKHDIEIIPDPNKPDPQLIADAIALAVNTTHATGKNIRVKLNTIPIAPDTWQQYKVSFNTTTREVTVSYGPLVDTSGTPITSENRRRKSLTASAKLDCNIRLDYQATIIIDIFDGPLLKMSPTRDHSVIPHFIPWHRQWSHSLVPCLLMALTAAAAWKPLAGMIIMTAYASHIAIDQIGFMGSNVLFPFRADRTHGLNMVHSNDALANFSIVWISCVVMFWNLYNSSPLTLPGFNLIKLLMYGVFLPGLAYITIRHKTLVAAKIRTKWNNFKHLFLQNRNTA